MELPLGSEFVEVDLSDCEVTVAKPPGRAPVDVRDAARDALNDPYGPLLRDRLDSADDICIVVTDITRSAPDDILLDVLLDSLADCGVDRDQVTVVVGLGLHRPMTDAELDTMLGPHADLAINHDPESVVSVGTVDGCPVEVGRPVANADAVLSTGVVEPHQYAGFSGGAKTVAIGAGSESLIQYSHGPEVLSREGIRLGRIETNPFRDLIDRAGDLIGVDFCLNLTHGPEGVLGVAAGDPRPVVETLSEVGRDALSVSVDHQYDTVVAGVGAPKDANLYQASRAATYVALGDYNPLHDGGQIVVPAKLNEGAGAGTGEQRFFHRLREADDPESLYEEMRSGYEPGAQRAFVLARVLCDHDVTITNSTAPDVVEACLMSARENVEDAVEPDSNVLVVPDALNTLLVSEGTRSDRS